MDISEFGFDVMLNYPKLEAVGKSLIYRTFVIQLMGVENFIG